MKMLIGKLKDLDLRVGDCVQGVLGHEGAAADSPNTVEMIITSVNGSTITARRKDRNDGERSFDLSLRGNVCLWKLISRSADKLFSGAFTGLYDMNKRAIYEGNFVRYKICGPNTKEEYWNPEYRVIYKAPSFTLEHVGGGKCGGTLHFALKYGGRNDMLEIIEEPTPTTTTQDVFIFVKDGQTTKQVKVGTGVVYGGEMIHGTFKEDTH